MGDYQLIGNPLEAPEQEEMTCDPANLPEEISTKSEINGFQ